MNPIERITFYRWNIWLKLFLILAVGDSFHNQKKQWCNDLDYWLGEAANEFYEVNNGMLEPKIFQEVMLLSCESVFKEIHDDFMVNLTFLSGYTISLNSSFVRADEVWQNMADFFKEAVKAYERKGYYVPSAIILTDILGIAVIY